jgi:hypothetical protein
MQIVPILWKTPVVAGAVVVGSIAANQAGWSGAELVVNSPLMGMFEDFVTGILFSVGAAISVGTLLLVQRLAKPVLWLMVPIFLYAALVLGAWNGFAGDFDATRLEAVKHRAANAYALEHMSPRGRFRSCEDERIELTDDAKAVCARSSNVGPGERIPGSEHRCGLLGMFGCFNTAPEKG